MDFDEFFDLTEDMRKYEELIKKGFDPGEILRDVTEWEELEEIDRQIKDIEEKYGMSYEEFYEHFESDISVLLRSHDLEEVMDDLARLIALIDAKEKLTGERIFDKLSEY